MTKKINWTNTLFLTLVPIIGIAGTIYMAINHQVHSNTLWLMFSYFVLCGLSITGGYHRLLSHRSYRAKWPVRLLFLLFGAASFEGSALEWCTDHRKHHRYTDTEKDPYSIKEGFWHAHIGWLLTLDTSKRDFSNVQDLQEDKLVRFQHRFFVPLAILMAIVLPCVIASFWGDALGGLLIAGALRITITQQATFCINSVCHLIGKRQYSDRISACDHWLTAFFTFGEGYHNFHHQFPIDYRNGIKFYHFDPTKWLIKGLNLVGLARDLKTVKQHRIIQYKIEMDHKRLSEHVHCDQFKARLSTLYHSISETITHLDDIEKAKQAIESTKQHLRDYREKAIFLKTQLKDWQRLVDDAVNMHLLSPTQA